MPELLRASNLLIQMLLLLFTILEPQALFAQAMMSGNVGACPMCGTMGWGGMVLGAVLIVTIIAALVILTVFLFRRSRFQ